MLAWLKSRWNRHARPTAADARFTTGWARHQPFDQSQAVAHFGSWVYAAAMLNAQTLASIPLKLYVRRRPGRKLFHTRAVHAQQMRYLSGDRHDRVRPSAGVLRKIADWRSDFEEVTEAHPALEVLSTSSAHHNGLESAVLRMLYLQVTGNAYLHPVIHPALGRPQELWILPSQWVTILPGKDQWIDGYQYGHRTDDKRFFATQQIIHWKLPSLENPYYGQSRVEAAWSALGLHDAKRQMDIARFDNHARPDYLLIVKQGASSEALDRFERQVDAKLRGVKHSGKFITITGDVQATPLNFPPDVIGDSSRVLEEIAACFGVPISKLLANDPNKAGAQTADTAWMRDTILSYCRLDEEKLNEAYLPLFGIEGDAFLAYDNPVPEDRRFALQRRIEYVRSGILSRNEARAEEGLPPVPGGDELTGS